MRRPEQLLWDAMRRNLPKELRLQRIENLVGVGMPDVYADKSGKWVELKVPRGIPARKTTPLLGRYGLNIDQINWHTVHATGDAPASYILVRVPETLELLLVPGSAASITNDQPLSELRRIAYKAHTWDEIAEELK
jgi:hypothetical protein